MTTEPARVLVIGGGGFLGGHILTALSARGFSVSALDLHQAPFHAKVDWIIGSASDESLIAATAGANDVVVYLAANSLPSSGNADLAAEVDSHLRLAVKTAELCCSQGVKTFVFASSGGAVYGPSDHATREDAPTHPMSAYGVTKLAIENYLSVLSRLRGMRCISLRVSNPFGPGQKANRNQGFIAAAMAAAVNGTTLTCWGDGSAIRDFVYVEDVAAAFALCCGYSGPSRVINIGSGLGHSLVATIERVESAVGRKIHLVFEHERAFDVPRNVLDVTSATQFLLWTPRNTFESGLRATARWWLSEKGSP